MVSDGERIRVFLAAARRAFPPDRLEKVCVLVLFSLYNNTWTYTWSCLPKPPSGVLAALWEHKGPALWPLSQIQKAISASPVFTAIIIVIIIIIYQAFFPQCQLARKFLVMREDSEWPNPSVYLINSLKAAKKREKRYEMFTAPTMRQSVCWALNTSWTTVLPTAQFADEKPEAGKFTNVVKVISPESG